MQRILSSLALVVVLPTTALAHDSHQGRSHALMEPGAFDHVPARAEYYGHFLQGHVHHGAAHHGGGHLNGEALISGSGQIFTAPDGKGFVVLVTPNLINKAAANTTADRLSTAHCAAVAAGSTVRYDTVQRHAPDRLESWLFQGRCR